MTWQVIAEGYEPITSLDGLTCETVIGNVNEKPLTCGKPATRVCTYAAGDYNTYDIPVCDDHPAAAAADGEIVKASVNSYQWLCARCGETKGAGSLKAARRNKATHAKSELHGDDIPWEFSEKKFVKYLMRTKLLRPQHGRYRAALGGKPLIHKGKAPRV